ncbi:MAG: hypothetical protein AAB495_00090 [Patescibacteria group bacterium]
MDKKRLAIEIVLVIIIITLGVALLFALRKEEVKQVPPTDSGVASLSEGGLPESKTRLPVPGGAVVPEAGGVIAGIASPSVVRPSGPGADTKIREFRVRIEKNIFSPDSLALYVGDVAHIDFEAVDKAYEVVQPDNGYRLSIPKGSSRLLEGQFNQAGKFVLYCESCGGPEKGPIGYITVVPKK